MGTRWNTWVSDEDGQLFVDNIGSFPDYPEPGVVFKDITPLLANGPVFHRLIKVTADRIRESHGRIDLIAGLEARGFLLGAALAYELDAGILPIRKAGKLPPPLISRDYGLEYGSATLELREGNLKGGERAIVFDDVLATGGTARAGVEILEQAGAEVVGLSFVMELEFLGGREKVSDLDVEPVLIVN